jgi:hypothetical protein
MHLYNYIWVVLLIPKLNLVFLSPKLSHSIDKVLLYLCPYGFDNPKNTLRWKLLQLASVCLRIILLGLRTANNTLKSDKGMHKRIEMLGIRIPYLVCIPRMESCHIAGLLGLVHWWTEDTRSSRSGGSPSLLPWHTSWVDVVAMWARSPLVDNGALLGLDGKEVDAPSVPRTILDVGSEWPLRFSSIA